MADQQTSRSEGLFRPEALEHRARQRGPGDVIRVAPWWATAAFYGLLALFLAGFVAGLVIEIDRYAAGPTATDDEGRLVVLLPAGLAPDVAPGRPVEIGRITAEVVSFEDPVLYPPDVAERFGIQVAGPSVAVVTSSDDDGGGIARVFIEREPAIVALIPGLKAIFGSEDA